MPVSQFDIDALTEALSTGERLVRKGDKTVEYRSVDEIKTARDLLTAELAAETAAATGTIRPKQTRLYHSGRGY